MTDKHGDDKDTKLTQRVLLTLVGVMTSAAIIGVLLKAPDGFFFFLSGVVTAILTALVRIVLGK